MRRRDTESQVAQTKQVQNFTLHVGDRRTGYSRLTADHS